MLTPSAHLVDAYLGEIAKGYGIAWSPPDVDDGDVGGEGGVKVRCSGAFSRSVLL